MKPTPNFRQFLISFGIAIVLLIPYELYFANVKHFTRGYDSQDIDLWVKWRAQIDELRENDIVILGSSRGHFDINIHDWHSRTGKRPVMLAYPGSSPYHTVEDIVDNTEFNGLLLVSVAPGLFFTMSDSWGAGRGKKLVDYYKDQTYAQKLNAWIYGYIDPCFAYLDPKLSYVSLVEKLPFPDRDSVRHPKPWPPMVSMDAYRNIRMNQAMEVDTSLQRQQTDIWGSNGWKNRFSDSIDVIMDHYVSHFNKLEERGAKLAFIRPPVTGEYLENEPVLYPREKYWDRLLKETGAPGFHFMDNEECKAMVPPEWSHLNRKDADRFTEIVIDFLQNEGLLN